MKVGITGTRQGCSPSQWCRASHIIRYLKPAELGHGDCKGVDIEIAGITREHLPNCLIVIYPPIDPGNRAFCDFGVLAGPPKSYFERNRDIVNASDVMIGVPKAKVSPIKYESGLGGTIYTLDYAINRVKKPTCIIWPDGSTEVFNSFPLFET